MDMKVIAVLWMLPVLLCASDCPEKFQAKWFERNKTHYFVSASSGAGRKTWSSARNDCKIKGGDLVTIKDDDKQQYVSSLRCHDNGYWIGLNRTCTSSKCSGWRWVDETSDAAYLQWDTNYPESKNAANCVLINLKEKRWRNTGVTVIRSYICEVPNACYLPIKPCQNDANCTTVKRTQYRCSCAPGFTGTNCETDIDECASTPCVYGTCSNEIGSHSCQCEPGYTGENCEYDINECASSDTCSFHGDCVNTNGSFICDCYENFSYPTCDKEEEDLSLLRNLLWLGIAIDVVCVTILVALIIDDRIYHHRNKAKIRNEQRENDAREEFPLTSVLLDPKSDNQ